MTVVPGGYQYRLREPYASPQQRGAPLPAYSRSVEKGMIIERNVAVRLRDGVRVFADVFRPEHQQPGPPIVMWTPYGKHWYGALEKDPNTGVREDMVSQYATFEGADPLYWVPLGYVIVNVDARGTWYSEGTSTFLSPEEAEAFYDVIEWAGEQPWSNGKVGVTGVSYLSQSQWKTAALQPPHLAAMNIWEGWSDTYREVARHGGIPDTSFWTKVVANAWGVSTHPIEDIVRETLEHPLFDDFWASKVADFSRIVTPAFIVASWTDQGMHLRGTLEGFKKIASQHKWLEVHGRKKWSYYYEPQSVARLRAFFDKFLLGLDSPVDTWPAVLLEVREKYYVGTQRREHEWPLARTQYTRLYLDARNGRMQRQPVAVFGSCRYDSLGSGPGAHRAEFEYVFEQTTELTGHMKLKLFMAAESAQDMDLFVGVYKFDAVGQQVPLAYYTFFNEGPVALGWLRASHRELDPARSTDLVPYHTHANPQPLEVNRIYRFDISLEPMAYLYKQGHRIRLEIVNGDSPMTEMLWPHYYRPDRMGADTIHHDSAHPSQLILPVMPAK
jgi:uncharacterized protein